VQLLAFDASERIQKGFDPVISREHVHEDSDSQQDQVIDEER
jgi:hypothetical protein